MFSQASEPGQDVPLLSPRGIWFCILETRVGSEEDRAKGGPALPPSHFLPVSSQVPSVPHSHQLIAIFCHTSLQSL